MSEFTFYRADTGEIKCVYQGSEIERAKANLPELACIKGVYDHRTQYIVDGKAIQRPAQSTSIDKAKVMADGEDAVRIDGAPDAGMFSAFNMDTGDKVCGPISKSDVFVTGIPGKIKLRIEAFPALPWEATIHAI